MDSRESVGSELVSEGGRFQQFVSKLLKYPQDITEKPASHCIWVWEKLSAYLSPSSSLFRFAQCKTQFHLLSVLIPWLLSCLGRGGSDPNMEGSDDSEQPGKNRSSMPASTGLAACPHSSQGSRGHIQRCKESGQQWAGSIRQSTRTLDLDFWLHRSASLRLQGPCFKIGMIIYYSNRSDRRTTITRVLPMLPWLQRCSSLGCSLYSVHFTSG